MNIKETEKTTGMPRASIRFYESEGLIQPGRNENGYRNYTDDDIKKLKKIKLQKFLILPRIQIQRIKHIQTMQRKEWFLKL